LSTPGYCRLVGNTTIYERTKRILGIIAEIKADKKFRYIPIKVGIANHGITRSTYFKYHKQVPEPTEPKA